MSIIKFTLPSDSKIIDDIECRNKPIKFIGKGRICQNLKETIYIRMIQFSNENIVRKVVYQKNGMSWGLKTLEEVNF